MKAGTELLDRREDSLAVSNPSCAYLALRSTCLWNNLLVCVWFLSVLMIALCSRDSVFPSEMKVTLKHRLQLSLPQALLEWGE